MRIRLQGPEPVVGPHVAWADKLKDLPRPIRLTFRRKLPPAGAEAAAAAQSSAVPCANPAQPAPLKSAKSAPSMCEWSPFIDVEHVTESTGVQFSTVSPSDCNTTRWPGESEANTTPARTTQIETSARS